MIKLQACVLWVSDRSDFARANVFQKLARTWSLQWDCFKTLDLDDYSQIPFLTYLGSVSQSHKPYIDLQEDNPKTQKRWKFAILLDFLQGRQSKDGKRIKLLEKTAKEISQSRHKSLLHRKSFRWMGQLCLVRGRQRQTCNGIRAEHPLQNSWDCPHVYMSHISHTRILQKLEVRLQAYTHSNPPFYRSDISFFVAVLQIFRVVAPFLQLRL